jgi:formylglycine-generating enzyme required for sulfatase activity
MHTTRSSRAVLAAAVLAAGIGGPAAVAAAAEPAPAGGKTARTGWHGETMPAGLERGEKKGEYVWNKDGSVMVYVPPGPFLMGSDTGELHEQPAHQADLDGYYIDKYEVSWRKWKASGLPYSEVVNIRLSIVQPPDWGIRDSHPVLNVDWHDAKRYAEWSGRRLPSEAEWEKAARGTDGRKYPWGNQPPDFERVIWDLHPISQESTAPVNCCEPGASPYGAMNMAGNVMEWCEDTYDNHYYAKSPAKNPVNRAPGDSRVLRGGAFLLEESFLRTYFRYRLLAIDRVPYIGFRTVLSGVAGAAP